jgi:DNA-binding MarR family transcriptional regulator
LDGLAHPDSNGHPALAREVLADHAQGSEARQLEAFEQAISLAGERAGAAYRAQEGWVAGVRAGLVALLEFFDEEPALAMYLVVHSAQAGPAVHARRREMLAQIATLLDDERAPARAYPPPLAAHAVASGVLGVLHAQLCQPRTGSLVELAGPLMSFTVAPFLGRRAAQRELHSADAAVFSPTTRESLDLLQGPGRRLSHHREIEVLRTLALEPGLNNGEIAQRAGVRDQGQASRLLARLQRLGLIENAQESRRPDAMKAWCLTASGTQLEAAIRREASAYEAAVARGLPEELAGRLDNCTVSVLRVTGEQPWLTSREIATRAGTEAPAQISRLLAQLADLGLVVGDRETHRPGAPKVWRLTNAGAELNNILGGEAPMSKRSVATDLMRESGGRLSEHAVLALKACAAEPGLSNGEVARRVGIEDANSISQLLARLLRRGLVENAREGGRQNVWLLTPRGETLEQAIRQEAPAPLERGTAFEDLKDRGGRLNHRVVSVLEVIDAEPGLSNAEVAQRLGVESKAHASRLLARLARFGLIASQVVDPALFEANAWRLTTSGEALYAAIRSDGASAAPRDSRIARSTTTTEETR